jgi:DNA polymerase I-like protein with 3'-5' exonuclease and polymerase domains
MQVKVNETCLGNFRGTTADITKKAPALLPQRLADIGDQIIGTVHDDIIIEVSEGLANDAAEILRKTMIGKQSLSR